MNRLNNHKETAKKAVKAYDRLDPGNTIITRKKFISRFLITRTIVSLITTILFIYAVYTAYNNQSTGFTYWFWFLGYICISSIYIYYTYDKLKDVFKYNSVKHNKYINDIDDNEHMYIYGKYVGKLSDFANRKNINLHT